LPKYEGGQKHATRLKIITATPLLHPKEYSTSEFCRFLVILMEVDRSGCGNIGNVSVES
jgi:hypothetical protein